MMRLESSYDQALIERCLYQIQIFFEMGIVERHAANEMIKESFFSIDYDHKAIWSDADSMVELFVEHFLKPLKAIVPDAFGFAAMLVVVPEENTDYDFRIVSREQMQEFIQAHLHDRDPRVSLIGDWLFVIRMDKFNLLPEPEE